MGQAESEETVVSMQLAARLREARERSGLSLVELGRRTHYSKSSWERWLNGRRPVPEDALRRFAEVTGEDVEALLASRLTAPTDDADQAERSVPSASDNASAARIRTLTPRSRLIAAGVAAAAVAAIAGTVAVVGLRSGGSDSRASGTSGTATGVSTHSSTYSAKTSCTAAGCAGQDPQAAGCVTDARVIAIKNIQKVLIWLKYSPACRAAWAKITDAEPPDTATITNSLGQSETAVIHYGLDAYSHMVDASAGVSLQVCGVQAAGSACSLTVPDASTAPLVSVPGATPSATSSH